MTDVGLGFMQSLWSPTAEATLKIAVLIGDVETNVVIVVAGFTVLSAALHSTEAEQSVVVLEANKIGWGAFKAEWGQVYPTFDALPSGGLALYETQSMLLPCKRQQSNFQITFNRKFQSKVTAYLEPPTV